MATYAIGDIQGCFDELQALLSLVNYDDQHDSLWFCGDLVNRGPKSLEVLRFVRSLGDRAITVLGNHDLHLLARYYQGKTPAPDNSLYPIFQAKDHKKLMKWLRGQPLAHYDKKHNLLMVHAGIAPQWNLDTTLSCAAELSETIKSRGYKLFFDNMYGDKPDKWSEKLTGWDRLRFIANTLTRLRYCDSEGRYQMKPKGAPGTQPSGVIPWFEHPARNNLDFTTLFGHWSTLGVHQSNRVISLDSGCLWGGSLTAFRIEDREFFSLCCSQRALHE